MKPASHPPLIGTEIQPVNWQLFKSWVAVVGEATYPRIFVFGICAGLILLGFMLCYWHGQEEREVEDEDYQMVAQDLLKYPTMDKERVYFKAQELMQLRVAQCMEDGKLSRREYNQLYAERKQFIVDYKFKDAKQQVKDALK